jgi:hypothetical protein
MMMGWVQLETRAEVVKARSMPPNVRSSANEQRPIIATNSSIVRAFPVRVAWR